MAENTPNAAAFLVVITSIIVTRIEKVTHLAFDDIEGFSKSSTLSRTRKEYLNSLDWLLGKKTDLTAHCAGIEILCAIMGYTGEELARRFGITEEKEAGYCPQKALNKLAQLFAVLGGASNESVKVPRQERILDSHIENALFSMLKEYKTHENAVVIRDGITGHFLPTTQIDNAEYKAAFGYRSMIDDKDSYKIDPALCAKIDALIDAGAASYETSTINTQSAQVKSALLSIGAAVVIVRDKEGNAVAKARAKSVKGQVLAPKAKFMRLIERMDSTNYPLMMRDER